MRKAFSLIELLIVIMIIGVVYTLGISNFQKINEKSSKVNLKTLKKYLHTFSYESNVKFLCLGDCSSCDIYIDGVKQTSLAGSFDGFLDESVVVYNYNYFLGTSQRLKEVYFNDDDVEEDVCFSYTLDKKGTGEQVFIEFNGNVYDYSTYFTGVNVYKSLQEAIEAKEGLIDEVLR